MTYNSSIILIFSAPSGGSRMNSLLGLGLDDSFMSSTSSVMYIRGSVNIIYHSGSVNKHHYVLIRGSSVYYQRSYCSLLCEKYNILISRSSSIQYCQHSSWLAAYLGLPQSDIMAALMKLAS